MNIRRKLVVMRHAAAETVADSDASRALTRRGARDAAIAGKWLVDQTFVPDHALVSSALRTRQTWEAMARAAGWDLSPEVQPALYAAGAESALDLLRAVPVEATQLVVLGHNPTVSYLALMLADGAGDPVAMRAMGAGYPTSATALFEVESGWRELSYSTATLQAFHASSQR